MLYVSPSTYYYKNHIIITIEKYESILPALESNKVTCIDHPEKIFEYFCKEHKCPCCVLCKRKQHADCRKIEKIEEVITEVNVRDECINLCSKVKNDLNVLKTLSAIKDQNILRLQEEKELVCHQIATNRKQIEQVLDKFDSDIKDEVERNFDIQKKKLLKQRDEYSKEICELEKCQNIIQNLSNIQNVSTLPFFLVEENAKKQLEQKECNIEKFKTELTNVSSQCVIEVIVDKESHFIRINKTIDFQENPCSSFESELEDQSETNSSSTIEEEAFINFASPGICLTPPGIPISPLPNLKALESNLFKYKCHFSVSSTDVKSGTVSRFIKALPENRLIINHSTEKQLLVFDRIGKKQGEIKLQFPATSAAVINESTVAVAAYRAVVIVNTKTFTFTDLITMGDNCFGVDYMQNKLVANCESKGITVMDIIGNVSKTLKKITGKIQLCAINDDTLSLAKQNSNTVELLNIRTGEITKNLLSLDGMKYVTSDTRGGVFIASNIQSSVFYFPFGQFDCKIVLDSTKGINKPLGLDFDVKTNEILVLNENGRSVYIFEKAFE